LRASSRPFLRHKSNHVIVAAAATAERLEIGALAPDLEEPFERLMRDPAKLDADCKATVAAFRGMADT
jgi:hypothetical protein